MKNLYHMTLEEIALDWQNNFVSVNGFAYHYNISFEQAHGLIELVRDVRRTAERKGASRRLDSLMW
jgi:hypothetical protein